MPPPPIDPDAVANREWPTLRARVLDVAAAMDRLDAAGDAEPLRLIRDQAEQLLRTLLEPGTADRAERLLTQLSRPYDPSWRERFASEGGKL